MSAITQGLYLAIQATRMYSEAAAAAVEMTEEEALDRYHDVARRLNMANEMWEAAAEEN